MSEKDIIFESVDELKNQKELLLKMPGNFLDYVAYEFPEPSVYNYDCDLSELTNKVDVLVKKSDNYSLFEKEDNFAFFFWTSSYGSVAEVNEKKGLALNPIFVDDLSNDELASIIFHEKGHLLGHHFELSKELTRISEIIDMKEGITNSFFPIVLSRYFEAEADKFSLAILQDIKDYDIFSYRIALLKYKFPFEHDIEDFSLEKMHISSHERIERLDRIKNLDINLLISNSYSRLMEAMDVQSYNDAIFLEEKWYKILSEDFTHTSDGIIKRILDIEKFSDRERFQYDRVFKKIRNLPIEDNKNIKYRDVLSKNIADIEKVIFDAKKENDKKLTVLKKGKLITKSLEKKGKEILSQWTR